jgi:hypothetical protein
LSDESSRESTRIESSVGWRFRSKSHSKASTAHDAEAKCSEQHVE